MSGHRGYCSYLQHQAASTSTFVTLITAPGNRMLPYVNNYTITCGSNSASPLILQLFRSTATAHLILSWCEHCSLQLGLVAFRATTGPQALSKAVLGSCCAFCFQCIHHCPCCCLAAPQSISVSAVRLCVCQDWFKVRARDV